MNSTLFTISSVSGATPKQQFVDVFERESAKTLRVLRAYPADKLDFKPAEGGNSARTLMWTFVLEQKLGERALTTGFDWSGKQSSMPKPSDTVDEIVEAFEQGYRRVLDLLGETPDERLTETVQWFVAPKQMGDVPVLDYLWMLLLDQIHHRGQLTVYLRMAGGKVPSIYGPSADEPWM